MSTKKLLFAISIFLFSTIPSFAQVSGVVFRDFNGNGVRENTVAYNETGLGGVVVNAYGASGATLTTAYTGGASATNLTGSYTITGGTLGQIRLEFIMPDGATFATKGANGGTTIMFPSSATQNLAVNAPDDYWDNATLTDPRYIVPCYVQGTINGAYRDEAAVVSFKQSGSSAPATYTNTGVVYPSLEQLVDKTVPCKISEVGTVWGVAFNKQAQTYYMTSFAKRHSGEGPLGYGGIYILESNGGGAYTKRTGINLQGITSSNGVALNFGTITRNQISNDDNEIADGANTPSRDLDAYAKVGSMSYGDTDFYEKEQKLFAVNMFQQSLLEIDATGISGLSGAALGAKVKSYPISTLANAPSCTGGALKSWGLKIYKDVGYLGIVCNAATSQVREDLKGFVMSFDPKNVAAGLTKVLDVNLNYRNGNEDWKPWSSTWSQTNIAVVADASVTYAEPAISDIEFDENGAMILGLMNLQGHKLGYYNYYPVSGNQDLLRGIAHGDILLACYDPAAKKWNLENTVAGCGPNYTLQNNFDNGYIATGRGPALGEFFDDASGDGSRETIMGSFAKVMGTNNLITTVVDPFPVGETSTTGYFSTGGMHWYDINTGSWAQQARLYGPDDSNNGRLFYGKAFGLGDIESELTNPAIEIGNRIWKDTDLDGVQDAGEAGIDGVEIELLEGSAVVATATSANGGQWYFNSSNVSGGLKPQTDYTIRVKTALNTGSLAGCVAYTIKDATTGGIQDMGDSDVETNGTIAYRTGSFGENNHNLDIGLISNPPCPSPNCGSVTVIKN